MGGRADTHCNCHSRAPCSVVEAGCHAARLEPTYLCEPVLCRRRHIRGEKHLAERLTQTVPFSQTKSDHLHAAPRVIKGRSPPPLPVQRRPHKSTRRPALGPPGHPPRQRASRPCVVTPGTVTARVRTQTRAAPSAWMSGAGIHKQLCLIKTAIETRFGANSPPPLPPRHKSQNVDSAGGPAPRRCFLLRNRVSPPRMPGTGPQLPTHNGLIVYCSLSTNPLQII